MLDEIQKIILGHYKDVVERGKNGKFSPTTPKNILRDALKVKLLESD